MEYWPGIAPVRGQSPLVITDNIINYYVEEKDVVATSTNIMYTSDVTGAVTPLTVMGFWRFNGKLIEQYDLVAINLGAWTIASGNDYTKKACPRWPYWCCMWYIHG